MSSESTKQKIIAATIEQFSLSTLESFSMRKLAHDVGVTQSVIYHYFDSKETLLKEVFDSTNTTLGRKRAQLAQTATVKEMFQQRVIFQLDHAREVVFVLRYYLAFRLGFQKRKTGFVPEKAYLHIEEVLKRGVDEHVFSPTLSIEREAKVITHAINGFLLEYYPYTPKGKEKKELVDTIVSFLWRGISKHDE